MELRKCCNHQFLVHGVVDGERDRLIDSGSIEADGMVMLSDDRKVMWPTVKEVVSYSGKMLLLEKLLPKLKADGHKVLIFSQFKIMLDLVEEFLASAKVHRGRTGCFSVA
jgi:SNF2 family DNA or RNA helicase